jgi:hypothetical protein
LVDSIKFKENSSLNSTIQAGDSSILLNDKELKKKITNSVYQDIAPYKSSKELILNFQKNNDNNISEFKAKCLNDISYLKPAVKNNINSTNKFTHVDILVPNNQKNKISFLSGILSI